MFVNHLSAWARGRGSPRGPTATVPPEVPPVGSEVGLTEVGLMCRMMSMVVARIVSVMSTPTTKQDKTRQGKTRQDRGGVLKDKRGERGEEED